ncbi:MULTISPECIES: glycosyltransferase [unclassified Clostridium]|uniref:glycosyltransferase n=1 Tax=unclassified Clostridium TaxID=2614128 RepID=UPI001C8C7B18|nr:MULTISPECIES: glycosyltransferase [unclassified Clostridium]MBX9136330.1 glycosyltransferase [Clostridium sp. K12(2020)]MBX9143398.1 glycosyltransferase [Clostridium sp. K13]
MNKVLHVLPMNKMSGAERMALLLCKNLKNYEPIVVCGGEELSNVFKENQINSYNIKFSNKKILANAFELSKIIKSEKVKIVHAHDNTASLISYLAKRLFKADVKIVSHIHNCYPFLKGNGVNKRIDKYLRNKYDFNITCGKIVTDFYKKNTDYFKENKNLTLSNAMDIKYITNVDENDVEKVVTKYKIPSNKKVLGFVGRLDEQKGIIPFINELSKHKEKFDDAIILLVGNGSQEDEIKALIKKLNLEDLFILTGFQENIKSFYPIIDIFFLPSLYEGLPMVLLEAMAFKKPIVSMNVGSISEVINNDTGILVNSEDYDKFINELIRLKNNENLSTELGESAFNFIESNFNIQSYVNKIESRYLKIEQAI